MTLAETCCVLMYASLDHDALGLRDSSSWDDSPRVPESVHELGHAWFVPEEVRRNQWVMVCAMEAQERENIVGMLVLVEIGETSRGC